MKFTDGNSEKIIYFDLFLHFLRYHSSPIKMNVLCLSCEKIETFPCDSVRVSMIVDNEMITEPLLTFLTTGKVPILLYLNIVEKSSCIVNGC